MPSLTTIALVFVVLVIVVCLFAVWDSPETRRQREVIRRRREMDRRLEQVLRQEHRKRPTMPPRRRH